MLGMRCCDAALGLQTEVLLCVHVHLYLAYVTWCWQCTVWVAVRLGTRSRERTCSHSCTALAVAVQCKQDTINTEKDRRHRPVSSSKRSASVTSHH